MHTLLSFILAIGVLVAFHELGHFLVARACGVRVLRFSIGFGPRLLAWTSVRSGTTYQLSLLPLGGYVKMLDEREAPVPPELRAWAFNTQSLRKRSSIVLAGPLANLLLAVLLYAGVAWHGQLQTAPLLPTPLSGSLADRAGLSGGEWVSAAALDEDAPRALHSFEELRWWITSAALHGHDLRLVYASAGEAPGAGAHEVRLAVGALSQRQADAAMFRAVGWLGPRVDPLIGEVGRNGAAQAAGLQRGDRVLRVQGHSVADAAQLIDWIRHSGSSGTSAQQTWSIQRGTAQMEVQIQPKVVADGNGNGQNTIGRIDAGIGASPQTLMLRLDFLDSLAQGVERTWQMADMSLTLLGRMLIGEASVKNLSGPITIADFAGQSAALGPTPFLLFLAVVSVSLGVLNLLPLPVLDGGHLVYYLWEGLTGRPVSLVWMESLQRFGVAVLLLMMSIAVFNDLTRLLG